jgi:hypothetical protein
MGKSKALKISQSLHRLTFLPDLFSIHENSRNSFISIEMQHTHHYLSIKPSRYRPSIHVVQFMESMHGTAKEISKQSRSLKKSRKFSIERGFRSLAPHLMEIRAFTNFIVNSNSIGISRHSMRQRLICFLIEGRND